MTRTKLTIGGALLAVAAVAAVVVVPMASGADEKSGGAPDPEGMQELRDCLSDQGVELPTPPEPPAEGEAPTTPPDPPSDEAMPSPEEMQEAMEACKQYAPDPPEGAPEDGQGPPPMGMPFGGPGGPGGPGGQGGMPCPPADGQGQQGHKGDGQRSGSRGDAS